MQAAKYALMTHLVAAVVFLFVSSLLCSVLLTYSETLLWLRLRQGWGGGGRERYSRVKKEKDAM